MQQSRIHGITLKSFAVIMIAHWLEHGVQAYQVYLLGYERHHALGLLGQFYPWLVHSEWMHFGYALLTWLGLIFLRDSFSGSAKLWWDLALIIQIWHLFEHTLLFVQAQGRFTLWGATEPTSVLQLLFPRIELHLFYNSVVTVPIVTAIIVARIAGARVPDLVTVSKTV
jgi:hypothetical protein